MRWIIAVIAFVAAVAVAPTWVSGWWSSTPSRASAFGIYQGYSKQSYDGVRRTSDYLSLRDGLRLAYDLILPSQQGVVTRERLPVLFKYTPYLRTWTIFDEDGHNRIADFIELDWKTRAMLRVRYWLSKDGHLFDSLFRTHWLEPMVKHGYAVVVVERPGTGASFGVMNPSFEANARSKALHFHRKTGLPTVADDSGLAVDSLGGAPGVDSKRFAPGEGLDGLARDQANNRHLLELLRSSEGEERSARYVCVAVLVAERVEVLVRGELGQPTDTSRATEVEAELKRFEARCDVTHVVQNAAGEQRAVKRVEPATERPGDGQVGIEPILDADPAGPTQVKTGAEHVGLAHG